MRELPPQFILDIMYQETLGDDQCAGCLQEPHPGVHCSEVAGVVDITRAHVRRQVWMAGVEAGRKLPR